MVGTNDIHFVSLVLALQANGCIVSIPVWVIPLTNSICSYRLKNSTSSFLWSYLASVQKQLDRALQTSSRISALLEAHKDCVGSRLGNINDLLDSVVTAIEGAAQSHPKTLLSPFNVAEHFRLGQKSSTQPKSFYPVSKPPGRRKANPLKWDMLFRIQWNFYANYRHSINNQQVSDPWSVYRSFVLSQSLYFRTDDCRVYVIGCRHAGVPIINTL